VFIRLLHLILVINGIMSVETSVHWMCNTMHDPCLKHLWAVRGTFTSQAKLEEIMGLGPASSRRSLLAVEATGRFSLTGEYMYACAHALSCLRMLCARVLCKHTQVASVYLSATICTDTRV